MEDGTWRRLLGEPPIVHQAKIERLRWAEHVIRMSEDDPVKMVLENDPTGSRTRGAQRASANDKVEGGIRSLRSLGECRQRAMNRVECRRLLVTAKANPAFD